MGIILAVIIATVVTAGASAGAFALLARRSVKELPEAKPTRKGREEQYVTRADLAEAIEDATKEMNYEWNEWYEKFDKLHLRLAKREKRASKVEESEQQELLEDRPSVLAFRRLGSV